MTINVAELKFNTMEEMKDSAHNNLYNEIGVQTIFAIPNIATATIYFVYTQNLIEFEIVSDTPNGEDLLYVEDELTKQGYKNIKKIVTEKYYSIINSFTEKGEL